MSIRVRFAPSPTGVLHIGSVRTALFNWLFARHCGGKFLLRIEDTDKVRSTSQNTQLIFEILEWLGIDWDEEPVIQSARIERHKEVAESLVSAGMAYRCYCSADELAAKKEKALAAGESYKYDGACRDVDSTAVVDRPFVIRLKTRREGAVTVADLVQGNVTVDNSQLDDFVLLRSDGTPTYMLSVVVDDHDMGVTHIIRGDDHLTNTFKQVQIYEACKWPVPRFAHIPLIYGPDGAKLSKRHGAASAVDYRELGYLPETISNYLLRLGWSHGDDEIISIADAIKWFTLESVGKSPARFDMKKLQNLNAHYIKQRENESLLNYMIPFLERSVNTDAKQRILRGMDGLKERAKTIVDLAKGAMIYVEAPTQYDEECAKYATESHLELLRSVAEIITALGDTPPPPQPTESELMEGDTERRSGVYKEVHEHSSTGSTQQETDYGELGRGGRATEDQISYAIKSLAVERGVKLVEIAQAMRAALCGKLVSPSVFQIIEVLGAHESVARISTFINRPLS
ncbi:MAG: glutamate--tRNA ligase [Holosporales bacterium]|nr:glutamate--tRNA ligase [Holosporales bacterium]